jgi:hypothetical protein
MYVVFSLLLLSETFLVLIRFQPDFIIKVLWSLYRSPVVSLGIFSVVPSNKTMCPEVDSASGNEYQGFLMG